MLTLPSHSVKPNLLKPRSNYWLIRLAAVCTQLAMLAMNANAPTPAAAANTSFIGLAAQPIKPATAKTIAAPQAPGEITGVVFNDYNDDGYRNLVSTAQFPAVDVGVPGIAVAAYTSAGTAIATTTTNANGVYTLTTGLAAGVPLRVEFTGYKEKSYESGVHGPHNNSSVRFVTTSDATIRNIDFGIYKTQDYCQNNPRVAITRFVFDDNLTGKFNTQPSCYSFPYATTSIFSNTNKAARTVQTVGNQTGAVYGVAYHKPSRSLFLSAYAKRGTGFGPGTGGNPLSDGTGTIYKLNPNTKAVAPFIDLDVVMNADVTGPDPHKLSDYDPLDKNASFDKFAYAQVGKMSLGDVDVDERNETLWAVNMYDRALYKLPIGLNATAPTASQITTYTIPAPNCINGTGRPMGMKPYQGKIYVGGVCANEAITSTKGFTSMVGATVINGLALDMRAYVYALDVATGLWSPAPVLLIPLNYASGCTDIYTNYNTTCGKNSKIGSVADWRPWADSFQQLINDDFPAGRAIDLEITGDLFTSYPQAMLADIEFTTNGDMVVGLRDRFSDQVGYLDPGPEQQKPFEVDVIAVASGDVLRASPNPDGSFSLENNAQSVPAGRFGPSLGQNNAQGPGGGEFYLGDDNAPRTHDESSYGSLAQMPGAPEIIDTAADPINAFSAGVIWLNQLSGSQNRAFQVYGLDEAGAFAKANGLGDVEILCEDPPIEIGNRVWVDVNFNGVQDPQEPPIPGIKVVLSDGAGVIAEAVTDGDGQYYFSNAITPTYPSQLTAAAAEAGPNAPNAILASAFYSLPIGYKATYTVSVAMTQPALALYQLTSPNKVDASPDGDIRDSDGIRAGNVAYVSFSTGTPNQNDHSFDFGFNNIVSLGNYVWADVGASGVNGSPGFNNGSVDADETGIPGVKLELYYDTNATGLFDAGDKFISNTTTNASGLYLFTNLSATNSASTAYLVVIPGTNFCYGGALFEDNNSTGSVSGNSDLNNRDHGLEKVGNLGCGDVVASSSVSLTVGGEPVDDGDTVPDPNSNLTLDFGFWPIPPPPEPRVSIGDLVWYDSNNDGIAQPTELGVDGVLMQLYQDSNGSGGYNVGDQLIGTTPTVNGGLYYFGNLTPTTGITDTYLVVLPSGNFCAGGILVDYQGSTGSVGGNSDENNRDHGLDPATGKLACGDVVTSSPVTLTYGGEPINDGDVLTTSNLTIDFGFYNSVSLGNYVWLDIGTSGQAGAAGFNNGRAEAGEKGISGVKMELYYDSNSSGLFDSGDQFISSTTTNANGLYLFTNLSPTKNANTAYLVVVSGTNFCLGGALFGVANSTGNVGGNSDENNRDHGLEKTGGDQGCGDVVASTPVSVTIGDEPINDDDTDPNSNLTLDFGFWPFLNVNEIFVSIGDLVWYDVNNDGIVAPAEVGVDGVAVHLYQDTNASGGYNAGDTLIDSVPTANGGLYFFGGLTPTVGITDTYIVVLPAANFCAGGVLVDYQGSTGSVGGNSDENNRDHGLDPATGQLACGNTVASSPVTLTYGGEPINDGDVLTSSNLSIDFGFYKLELGNYVWLDSNNDGKADAGEPSLPNVPVRLLNSGGTVLSNTVTNASGFYTFTGLVPGTYCAEISPTPPYTSSTGPNQSPTPDNNIDSDDNGTTTSGDNIRSNCMQLTAGGEPIVITNTGTTKNPTLDFGLWAPAGLGNYVWIDQNQNGQQNTGETPVPNHAVTLYNSARQAISNTKTNVSGSYLFTGLVPGSYYVCFAQPTSPYTFTLWMSDTTGLSSDSDSNADTKNGNCTLPVTLRVAEYNPTLDAGMYQPTAVLLSDFSVAADGNALRIGWRTIREINTFGFMLYRSATTNRSDAVLITNELISAKGGGSYTVNDTTADPTQRYSYWLQETETTGALIEYGPANYVPQVSVAAVLPVNAVASAGGVPVDGAVVQNVAPNTPNMPARLLSEANPQSVEVVAQAAANPVVGAVEVARSEPSAQLEAQPAGASSAPAEAASPVQNKANAPAVTQSQAPSTQTQVRVTEPKNIHQAQVVSRPVEPVSMPSTSPRLSTWFIVLALSLIAFGVAGTVLGLAVWVGRRRE